MPFCAKKFQFRVNQLCNAENANAFRAMEALLQDLENALREIQIVKIVTDANNFHVKILKQYREMIKKEIAGFKEESKRDQKVLKQRLHGVEEAELEQIRITLRARDICFGNKVKNGVVYYLGHKHSWGDLNFKKR